MLALLHLLCGGRLDKRFPGIRRYLFANIVLDVLCAACWVAVKTNRKNDSLAFMLATTVTTFGANFVSWRLLTWRRSCLLPISKIITIIAFACAWTIGVIMALQFWARIDPVWRGLVIGVGGMANVCFVLYFCRGNNPPRKIESETSTGRH